MISRPLRVWEEGKLFHVTKVGSSSCDARESPPRMVLFVASSHTSNTDTALWTPKLLATSVLCYSYSFSVCWKKGLVLSKCLLGKQNVPHPGVNPDPTVGWSKRLSYETKASLTSLDLEQGLGTDSCASGIRLWGTKCSISIKWGIFISFFPYFSLLWN